MKRDRQAGFTLLEVLIATAILGTAVVTLLGLHARNVSMAAEIADRTVAGMLTSQVMTATRIAGFPELGETEGGFTAEREDRFLDTARPDDRIEPYGTAEAARFRWQREVLPTALDGLRQVRIAVTDAGSRQVLAEVWFAVRAGR